MDLRWMRAFVFTVALDVTCSKPEDRALPACVAEAPTPAAGVVTRVVAVGDVADCSGGRQAAVAALVERLRPDAVMALGDLAYPNGSVDDFLDCYEPSFGRFREITHPVVGNHEYHTPHAGAYYAYFCGALIGPALALGLRRGRVELALDGEAFFLPTWPAAPSAGLYAAVGFVF